MDLKYTTVGTVTITLPDALVWSDEMEWSSVVSTVEYSATGALFVQSGQKLKGRSITLTGVPGLTWITRTDLITLNTWKNVLDAEFELVINTVTYDVMFRNQEIAVEVSPVVPYNHRDSNALFQINSLKFMEI